MDNNKKRILKNNYGLLLFIILALISFVALNIGMVLFFGSDKLDVTSQKLYTLSETTLDVLNKNEEDIYIRVYISPELDKEYPSLSQYSQTVLRFLEQYKQHSNFHINLEVLDVLPYSPAEKEAKDNKIRGFLDKSGQTNLYFGAVISNEYGNSFTIPYFEPRRQNYLEHDVTRIISKMNGYLPKTIAVVSPVFSVMHKKETFNYDTDWAFIEQLGNDYNMISLAPTTPFIPKNVDTLMLINPQRLSNVFIYALDQFIMRGGNVMIFIDPYSEIASERTGYINPATSSLKDFLANLGVNYEDDLVVGDKSLAQQLLINGEDNKMKDYPLWMNLKVDNINPNHPLTSRISQMLFKSAGALDVDNPPLAKAYPLLMTSDNSGHIEASLAKYSSPSKVLELYSQGNKPAYLAWFLEGNFPSFFSDSYFSNNLELSKRFLPFMSTSINPSKLLIVADSDILATPNWNDGKLSPELSVYDLIPYNNNMDFVQKSADDLTESSLAFVGSKNQSNAIVSINDEISVHVLSKHKADYEEYNNSVKNAKLEQEKINEQIKNNEIVGSIMVIKKLEALQRDIATGEENIRRLDYQLKQEKEAIRRNIIIMNSVIFPLLMIVIMALVFHRHRRRNIRNAERLLHEQKNA